MTGTPQIPDPEKLRGAAHNLDFPFMAPSIKEQHEAAALLRLCADHLEASASALAAMPADSVKMPTTEAEAELMAKVGMMWLEQHAPHKLKQQAGGVPAGFVVPPEYLTKFMGKGGGIVQRFYNGEDQSVVDAGAWMQEAMQLLQALAAAPTPPAVPRVVDKAELKRLVSLVFGEEFQITQAVPTIKESLTVEQKRKLLESADHLEGDGHFMSATDAEWTARWIRRYVRAHGIKESPDVPT